LNFKKYYVRHAEATRGPLTMDEIVCQLRLQQLTWLDFAISVEIGAAWRMLWEFDELREALTDLRLSAVKGSWVVRCEQGLEAGKIRGPYLLKTLLQMLAEGSLRFSDSVWSDGFERWFKVSERNEFDRGLKRRLKHTVDFSPAKLNQDIDCAALAAGQAATLKDVVRRENRSQNRPTANWMAEQRPLEADGEDLIAPPAWMKPMLMAFLCFWTLQSHAASTLRIGSLKLSSADPILVFETDASPSEEIKVRVRGFSGEILQLASFDRTFIVQRQGGEIPSLSLKKLALPAGTYHVDATVGATHVEQTVFLGTKDEAFDADLVQHQKQIATAQQTEKKALFYGAKRFRTLSRMLSTYLGKLRATQPISESGWRAFYGDWERQTSQALELMKALQLELQGRDFMFPEQMANFQGASRHLIEIAQKIDQNISADAAKLSGGDKKQTVLRSVASDVATGQADDQKAIANEAEQNFKTMMDDASQLSVYKQTP